MKWIRWVIHIGCPQNIPLWVQQSGRAGRDGKQASAAIFFNEHADLQRLKFWVRDVSPTEKASLTEDFIQVWQYIYSGMAGICLHSQQMSYFGETTEPPSQPATAKATCAVKAAESILIFLN